MKIEKVKIPLEESVEAFEIIRKAIVENVFTKIYVSNRIMEKLQKYKVGFPYRYSMPDPLPGQKIEKEFDFYTLYRNGKLYTIAGFVRRGTGYHLLKDCMLQGYIGEYVYDYLSDFDKILIIDEKI